MRDAVHTVIRGIGSEGKGAVPKLIEFLGPPEESLRIGAAYALGRIGPEAAPAISSLIELCQGTDRERSCEWCEVLDRSGKREWPVSTGRQVIPPYAMTCITGPSRTADIKLTITTGIHGPRALQVVLHSCSENKEK